MTAGDNDSVEPDYDTILRANAERVFSQRDPAVRRRSLNELWVADGVLYEDGHSVTGLDAISDAVGVLLETLPSGTTFAPNGRAVGHHGLGRLRWRSVDGKGRPGSVTGTDIAFFRNGKIARLYVLLDASE